MQNANTTSHFPNAFMMFTVEMRPVARLECVCVCVLSVNVCKREAAAAVSGERGSSAVAEAATLATNEEKSTGAAMHTHAQTHSHTYTNTRTGADSRVASCVDLYRLQPKRTLRLNVKNLQSVCEYRS